MQLAVLVRQAISTIDVVMAMARSSHSRRPKNQILHVSHNTTHSLPLIILFQFLAMVNNLKACLPTMFQLFTAIKERPADQPITQEEIELASGSKVLDPGKVKEYFKNLEAASENICTAFEKQSSNAAVRMMIFNSC